MRAGFGADDPYATPQFESAPNWLSAILARPLVAKPGTTFAYDGGATHLLSVVLTKATGMPADEYARQRLFRPLGIPDARWTWERDGQGNPQGPTGLSLRARDMARIGYLLLHHGRWRGKQVVPADYVRDATATQERAQFLAGGPALGYGYQFWTLGATGFAAVGYGGQTIAVFPKLDLVVVTKGSIDAIDPNGLFQLVADVARAARSGSDRP
jgi:CubicO group peptidase (beta-lactamase class C family)